MCRVFVGRDAELRRLGDLLTTADSATTSLVLLDGPLGIGKTALVRHCVATLIDHNETAPSAVQLTYSSAIDEMIDDDGRDNSSGGVLIIDDADRLTPAAQRRLGNALQHPICSWNSIVLVQRTGAALAHLVTTATRVGSLVTRVDVGPLAMPSCRLLTPSRPARIQRRLAQLSQGNPRFLHLLAVLDDEVIERVADGGCLLDLADVAPWALDDILAGECDQLTPTQQHVLASLAVTGAPGCDTTSPDAAELLRRGLVEPDRRRRLIRLTHPLIGIAAYRRTPAAVQDQLHRAAAAAASAPVDRAEQLFRLRSPSPAELAELVGTAQRELDSDPGRALRWLGPQRDHPNRQRDVTLAHALVATGRTQEAEELLNPLLSADPTPDVLRMVMYCRRMTGRLDEARDLLRTAARSTDPALRIETATLLMMIDDLPVDSLLVIEEPADHLDRPARTATRWLTALLHLKEGRADRAREHLDAAIADAGLLTSAELAPFLEATAAGGWAAFCLEAYEPAAHLLARAIGTAERLGHTHAIAHLCTVRAFHLIQLGQLAEADEHAHRALTDTGHFGWPDTGRMARGALLHSALWQGDHDLLAERRHDLRAAGLPSAGIWRRSIASLLTKTGFQLGCAGTPPPVDEYPDAMLAIRYIDAGYIALARDDVDHADDCADAARTHSVGEIQTAQAILLRAQVAQRHQSPTEALDLADQALAILRRHPVPLHRRLAEARRAEYRDSCAAIGLTRRELQIAGLVVLGRSNREIAAELVISPRTVEDHVANILRKRGLKSRAALAHDLGEHSRV